jgi:hypothetical protein
MDKTPTYLKGRGFSEAVIRRRTYNTKANGKMTK